MTEPVEEFSYPWLVLPPNVGSQVTVGPLPPLLALTREVKVSSQMARTISNAAQGKIFLITVTSSLICVQVWPSEAPASR
jgi:hypothetical protein